MRERQEWTNKEKRLLMQLKRSGSNWVELGKVLKRTPAACRVKHNRLVVLEKMSKERTNWTAADENTLKNLHLQGTSLDKIAIRLQRTEKAIVSRMYVIGLMDNSGVKNRIKSKPKVYATSKLTTGVSASTIFDYVKKLEVENAELHQRIENIRKVLGLEELK